jgi:plastocyanin domain-containing protein
VKHRTTVTLVIGFLLTWSAACKRSSDAHHGHATTNEPPRSAAPGETVTIRVDGSGYHPSRIRASANTEITLSFLRTTDECCGQQLKVPSMNITRDLPLNQAVPVTVRVPPSGELAFTCGMDMYRGAVVVQ